MTIKEVLEADWNVNEIEVTIREESSTKFIRGYHIGENVKPPKHRQFLRETKAGDKYTTCGMEHIYINKIIQFRDLPEKPQGKEMCVGVVTKNIPKEILDLEIDNMTPLGMGKSSGMHKYHFDCYVPIWFGIPGEGEEVENE